MEDNIQDWDPRWSEPDPKILTLRKKIHDMGILMHSNDSIMQESIHALIEEREKTKTQMTLFELVISGKISYAEMSNLRDMLNSVDEENKVVAQETINNLLKQ